MLCVYVLTHIDAAFTTPPPPRTQCSSPMVVFMKSYSPFASEYYDTVVGSVVGGSSFLEQIKDVRLVTRGDLLFIKYPGMYEPVVLPSVVGVQECQ
jgi:hypothetical protein